MNAPSQVVGNMIKLPCNLEGFKENTQSYFSGTLATLSKVLVLLLPCAVGLWFVIRWLYGRSNIRHNKDTVPLVVFKFISRCTYQPLKRFVRGYLCFLREHGWIWRCWIAVWVFHFNLASILTGFLAYYFYFAVSFDLATLYPQICRLFIDVQIPFRYFPYWSLLFVAWHFFQRWCRKIALSRLRRYEARNLCFSNEWILPITNDGDGSLYICELKHDLTALVGKPKKIISGKYCGFSVKVSGFGKEGYVAEGPYLYEESDKIVLLWSTFTQNGYSVVKSVSSNGVMGDYVFEKLLYDHDGGHSMSFLDMQGRRILTFHQPNRPNAERMQYFLLK